MALVLSSERTSLAHFSLSHKLIHWISAWRNARMQKLALVELSNLDDHLLTDIGLTRESVIAAEKLGTTAQLNFCTLRTSNTPFVLI